MSTGSDGGHEARHLHFFVAIELAVKQCAAAAVPSGVNAGEFLALGARLLVASAGVWIASCGSTGSAWVAQPPGAGSAPGDPRSFEPPAARPSAVTPRGVKRILDTEPRDEASESAPGSAGEEPPSGVELGSFRNTYYNFPNERDYRGPSAELFDSQCQPLAKVPRTFHDTLCVQGSGSLASGHTVSFARRNCQCARTCPRSGQKICFATLDRDAFPWGRGAMGSAIVPLRSVAVDISVIPLGTPLFIPEFVGLPLDRTGQETHDGCFLAEDRGIQVIGQHVDIFTGAVAMTKLWDGLVPTNRGVTVYIDSPHCPRR
jgi:3D (Asp-Asp-Asp) domain-containing protein